MRVPAITAITGAVLLCAPLAAGAQTQRLEQLTTGQETGAVAIDNQSIATDPTDPRDIDDLEIASPPAPADGQAQLAGEAEVQPDRGEVPGIPTDEEALDRSVDRDLQEALESVNEAEDDIATTPQVNRAIEPLTEGDPGVTTPSTRE